MLWPLQYRCKVSFPKPFLSLEQIMEIKLAHQQLALHFPFLQLHWTVVVELLWFEVRAEEFDAFRRTKWFGFWVVLGSKDLENGIERDHEAFLNGLVWVWMVKDRLASQNKSDWVLVVGSQVKGGAEERVRGRQIRLLLEQISLICEHEDNYQLYSSDR